MLKTHRRETPNRFKHPKEFVQTCSVFTALFEASYTEVSIKVVKFAKAANASLIHTFIGRYGVC